MSIEGAIGMIAGVTAGSIALMGWALSSGVEGLASIIVIWRFTGSRTHSESAEARAQKAVAVSFWLLAPYVASESLRNLFTGHRPQTSLLGIVLTISSLLAMPALGVAKHRRGEGTQNILCACLAAAVLVGLMANARLGWWWLDPLVAWSSQGSRSRKGGPLGAAMAPAADSPSKGEPKSLRPGGPKTS